MAAWAVTKKKNVIELRAAFKATGCRFAQVLIKISMDGVPPPSTWQMDVDDDPQVVISMNGTAGMSFDDYREMVKQIDIAIEQVIKQSVGDALDG